MVLQVDWMGWIGSPCGVRYRVPSQFSASIISASILRFWFNIEVRYVLVIIEVIYRVSFLIGAPLKVVSVFR